KQMTPNHPSPLCISVNSASHTARGSIVIFHQYEDERSNAMRGDKKVLLAAMLGATVMAAPAVSTAQAQSPWYIGGSLGQMEAKGSCPAGLTCDFKDNSWKVFGGYQLNRTFALEGK